jgi:hypothetical protein
MAILADPAGACNLRDALRTRASPGPAPPPSHRDSALRIALARRHGDGGLRHAADRRPVVAPRCLQAQNGNRSRVESDTRTERIKPRSYFPDASVDPTEARNEIDSRDATSGAIGSSVQPIMRNSSRNSSVHESRGAKLARIIVIGASSRAYDAVAPANHVVGAIPSHACSLVLRGEPGRAPGRGRAASAGARAGAPGRVGPDGRSHPHPLCDRARRRAGSRAAPAAGLRRAAPVGQPETGPGKAWSELQATGLVHEVDLRLLDDKAVQRWESRRHFFVAAAEALRRILIDRVRKKHACKRVCRTTAKRFPTMRRPSPSFPTTARWASMNPAFSLCWVTNVARASIKTVR